ncbi:MAG: hypothetical protein U0K48_05770 [Bacilli bacterium]|nr:hypothetical protein [Bacilli bacterium]
MKLKKEKKIRKLLGNQFHLCVDNYGNWKLFRKYDNSKLYFSVENIDIMNSNNNSEKELLRFAKKNRRYDADKVIFNTTLTIVWLNVILASVNIFINSEVIRGFILGIDFLALWQSLIKMVVSNHNLKCKTKALKEKIELTKRIADNDRRHL